MAFSNFPYTDFHNLNLDWVLATTKDLNAKWDDYYQLGVINGFGWEKGGRLE